MVRHLAQNAKGAGSSPAQHYTFRLREKFTLRENYLFITITDVEMAFILDQGMILNRSQHG